MPTNIALNLHTDRGAIHANDINGPIVATTQIGDIELKNIGNTITAQTEESGIIRIEKAQGNVKAITNIGDIFITDASKSIIANAQKKGNIYTTCTEVPPTSKIALNSDVKGTITLTLPSTVNATVQGKTARGRFTSDHYITIKPFTTKLNKYTRKELERQIDGIIGTGEADIRVSSNGDIKLRETKTT